MSEVLPRRPWLGAHRVHIRPARAGLAFGALLLALWIAAVNYQLGLGYALTCLAGACAVADMLFASRNLAGLSLSATPGAPVAVGTPATFELCLTDRSARARHAIDVHASGSQTDLQADIGADGRWCASIAVPAVRRGWLAAPPVQLSASFPLGLFYAWCHWLPEVRVLVYPTPEQPAPALPDAAPGRHGEQVHGSQDRQNSQDSGQRELAGVRAYQPGDALQRLAWRQIARHDGEAGEHLYTKQFEASPRAAAAASPLLFDFQALPDTLDTEARLSRLTAWVLQAESASRPYGLRLAGVTLAPAIGAAHQTACLRALALYGQA